MSQQQFEEMGRGYQPQANYPPYPDPGQGMQSSDQVGVMSGLKIGRSYNRTTPTIGQRLALAIVSICMLGPIMLFAALIYPLRYNSDLNLLSIVIALGMVCASLLGINLLFYKAGSGVASPGQRLALAIVSICALALSILMVGVGSLGLIIIGILCITIITINLLFSTMHH
jgi:hypothetical protein